MFVRPFHEFEAKYNPSKMRGLYKKAIYEVLEVMYEEVIKPLAIVAQLLGRGYSSKRVRIS